MHFRILHINGLGEAYLPASLYLKKAKFSKLARNNMLHKQNMHVTSLFCFSALEPMAWPVWPLCRTGTHNRTPPPRFASGTGLRKNGRVATLAIVVGFRLAGYWLIMLAGLMASVRSSRSF